MPITLVTGPANAGKARVVMDAVRRHLAHGERPLLVVPTRADVEHYLRELAGEQAAIGVRVERFAGLLEEAARRARVGERPLGTVAREQLLAALAAREGIAGAPGYVRCLGELFAELRARRVSPARLARALSSWREVDRSAERAPQLERLFAEYCRTLERLGLLDEERRAVCALDALRERPSLWGDAPVLFYGFDDLTAVQLDAIETLGRVIDAPVTVSLAYEPGRTAFAGRAASFHALAPLAREHRELPARAEHYAPAARAALGHLERSLFEPRDADASSVPAGDSVRLLEGGGERAELELVARELSALLERGTPPGEIAVLVRGGGTDLDLLEEVLRHAGVPFALARRRAFGSTVLGAALVGALRCAAGRAGEQPGEVSDLLAWLRAPGGPGALAREADGCSAADRLELDARRAGARDAEAARALWERRNWPLERLDRLADAQRRGPLALCERAAWELQRLFCAPRRGTASVLAAQEREEAAALSAGRAALAELRELARAAPELAPATAGELTSVLERLEVLSGAEDAAADAVAVLDPLALRARRVHALFVCGLQEGVFPAPARAGAVLAQEERRALAQASGLRLAVQQDALAVERYLLYAAVSRPQRNLFLSWHTADDDGEATPRSLFVDDVCDVFTADLHEQRVRRALGALDGARGGSTPAPGTGARAPG
ncbi:MAG TPA: hypothetical protein VKV16_09060, partial [Solirubrobacteraceae bacterium]|nr:hypothetical protein [Solirubrobacteraceae bacterium]